MPETFEQQWHLTVHQGDQITLERGEIMNINLHLSTNHTPRQCSNVQESNPRNRWPAFGA